MVREQKVRVVLLGELVPEVLAVRLALGLVLEVPELVPEELEERL